MQSPRAEVTFAIPDIKAGILVAVPCCSAEATRWQLPQFGPYLAAELVDVFRITVDIGFAQDIMFVGLGYKFVDIFEINGLGIVGWDAGTKQYLVGVGAGVLKF
jgi:hypothetical protein